MNGFPTLLIYFASFSVADLPYPEEVHATYYQNYSGFGAFRIMWILTSQYEPAYREDQIFQLQMIEKAIKDKKIKQEKNIQIIIEERIADLRQYIKGTEGFAGKPFPLSVFFNEIWTDWNSVQIRAPRNSDFPKEFRFPEGPIRTPTDLIKAFPDVKVLSWSQVRKPKSWMWRGLDPENKKPSGAVTDGPPDSIMRFRFPPLGLIKPEWGSEEEVWHPIDQLLGNPTGLVVVGETQIEGNKVLLVKRPSPRKGYMLWGWLDPNRGFLPIRIERKSYEEGKKQDNPPIEIVHVTRIDKIDGAGFYPMEGRREHRMFDHRPKPDTKKEKGKGLNKEVSDELYTYLSEEWKVEKVEHHLKLPAEMFQIGFPEGTIYYDYTTKQYSVVGNPQAVIDDIIGAKSEPEEDLKKVGPSCLNLPITIISGLILVLLTLAILFKRGRKKI